MLRFRKKINKAVNNLLDFISKKININVRHLIAYLISKLYSSEIDNKLLVFGSTNGNAFSGNSKYLFLYLTQHSKYHCIWVTSSQKVSQYLQNNNYNVVLNRNLFKTIKLLKAARYIFITHGFSDILMVDLSPQTQLIRLDHGIVLKRLRSFTRGSNLNFIKKKMRQQLVRSTSYLVVASEIDKKMKMQSFPLNPNQYMTVGYPRNDILANFTREKYLGIRQSLDIKENSKILLYAPTSRKYQQKNQLNKEFLENLDQLLIKDQRILLYKPHPASKKIDLSVYNNIKSVDPNVDIMDLLIVSDVLITDYSGVFYDFLITLRPIIFFAYDRKKYFEKRGIYFDYETFVPGPIVKTGEQLLLKLKEIDQWAKEYEKKRKNIRELTNKYSDGNSTRKLIEFLNLEAN
ncbi:MAG: CDP-glycerol glycerophosphotransferase family protein [Candidatus Hodarchaeota archaeon]